MRFVDKIAEAKELIKKALAENDNLAVGCSFGKDSMVVLHLAREVEPNIPVFSVLAETEFDETFEFRDQLVKDWNLNYSEIIFQQPNVSLDNSTECCGAEKVQATRTALKNFDAWISGVRNTEGITRADFQFVEEKNGLTKYNPILNFTETDVWRYLAVFGVPTNSAYQRGFRSMGCAICSTPEQNEHESERAGRWRGTQRASGECGIHTLALR